jgi:hypothetical protein
LRSYNGYNVKSSVSSFTEIKISQKKKDIIYFGEGYKEDSAQYHSRIKPKILKSAGKANYVKIVGDNPDIQVNSDKIILIGVASKFRGKSYETDLDASSFLSKGVE